MAAAPPSSASAAVAPSTAGAAGTGARYSRVLSGAGEAYINLDAYLSDVVAYLQELAGSPEGSTRYLDLASDRGEVQDCVGVVEQRPRIRADDLLKPRATYILVEYRTDAEEKPHSSKRSTNTKEKEKEKEDGAGFVPLVNIVPPGFELRFSRTAVAKKK